MRSSETSATTSRRGITSQNTWTITRTTTNKFPPQYFYSIYKFTTGSRDIVVGVMTSYGLDGPVFESRHGKKIFSSSKPSGPALGPTQRPIKWVFGFFLGIKRQEREVDHSPSSGAEVKNEWSCRYLCSPCSPHGFDRDSFTFTRSQRRGCF